MDFLAELTSGEARDLLGRVPPVRVAASHPDGAIVRVTARAPDAPPEVALVAAPGSARAAIHHIAARHHLDPLHPEAVEREADALVASPGLDDPSLVDLEHLPFCTIDNDDSRDLDQALCIGRVDGDPDAVALWYALADASYYVRPGTALFAEALARGASYYLPGLVAPMLPRSLSEGLVSLNPDVPRRSLVFRATLDARGEVTASSFVRARIRSRAKLSYHGVSRHYATGELAGHDYSETLDLLKVLGLRRIALAEARHVVTVDRQEVEVGFADADGLRFVAFEAPRTEADRYNEQVSLLVNSEGAAMLARHLGEGSMQAIFRVHPEPAAADLAELERRVGALADAHGLDPSWRWEAAREPLASYLARLPPGPVARAIDRQSLLVNQRSSFAAEPGLHYGVGAALYARFSSPMREIVGVFTHKEALEALARGGRPAPDDPRDAALREEVIARANAGKELQRQLTKASNQLVIDRLLAPGLAVDGVILGLAPDKLYVELDEPPLEVKVYAVDLGPRFALEPSGVAATSGGRRFVLGDRVALSVLGHDDTRDRWRLAPRT